MAVFRLLQLTCVGGISNVSNIQWVGSFDAGQKKKKKFWNLSSETHNQNRYYWYVGRYRQADDFSDFIGQDRSRFEFALGFFVFYFRKLLQKRYKLLHKKRKFWNLSSRTHNQNHYYWYVQLSLCWNITVRLKSGVFFLLYRSK